MDIKRCNNCSQIMNGLMPHCKKCYDSEYKCKGCNKILNNNFMNGLCIECQPCSRGKCGKCIKCKCKKSPNLDDNIYQCSECGKKYDNDFINGVCPKCISCLSKQCGKCFECINGFNSIDDTYQCPGCNKNYVKNFVDGLCLECTPCLSKECGRCIECKSYFYQDSMLSVGGSQKNCYTRQCLGCSKKFDDSFINGMCAECSPCLSNTCGKCFKCKHNLSIKSHPISSLKYNTYQECLGCNKKFDSNFCNEFGLCFGCSNCSTGECGKCVECRGRSFLYSTCEKCFDDLPKNSKDRICPKCVSETVPFYFEKHIDSETCGICSQSYKANQVNDQLICIYCLTDL